MLEFFGSTAKEITYAADGCVIFVHVFALSALLNKPRPSLSKPYNTFGWLDLIVIACKSTGGFKASATFCHVNQPSVILKNPVFPPVEDDHLHIQLLLLLDQKQKPCNLFFQDFQLE
jgi:hypothetical protein